MLKDITLGQYFPGTTAIHRLDPRTKLIISIVYIILIFLITNLIGYAICAAAVYIVIRMSKIPLSTVIRSVKPLMLIIVLTAILNVFYTSGTVIFKVWIISVTYEGIVMAVYMIFRLMFLIVGTSMLTYTTSPIMLTDAIENLLGPLKRYKVPVHEFAMMMTIALRFIPTLIEETDKIMSAQKARGGDFESGGIIKRAKALVPILVPLFVSAFRRADDLAVAMECRCYRGGENRTRLKQLKMSNLDVYAFLSILLFFGAIIASNFINMGLKI